MNYSITWKWNGRAGSSGDGPLESNSCSTSAGGGGGGMDGIGGDHLPVSSSESPLGTEWEEPWLLVANGNEVSEVWSPAVSLILVNVGGLPGFGRIIVGLDVIEEDPAAPDELGLLCL